MKKRKQPAKRSVRDSNREPYPGFAADKRRHDERVASADRAAAAILPGALRAAFAGDVVRELGFTLQPISLGLTANLERIKSPLLDVLRIMREEIKGELKKPGDLAKRLERAHTRIAKEIKAGDEAVVETVFIFVTPQEQVRKLLDAGPAVFRENAMRAIGDKLHPVKLGELQRACAAHYAASFETVIVHESPPAEDDTVNFPPPPPRTASAGG